MEKFKRKATIYDIARISGVSLRLFPVLSMVVMELDQKLTSL